MATYILLMTLTPEGRVNALDDPEHLLHVEDAIRIAGVQTMGLYAVLGQYDFVTIIEAPDNEAIARFSIELGVRAGAHITTLPTIPTSRLESSSEQELHTKADVNRPQELR